MNTYYGETICSPLFVKHARLAFQYANGKYTREQLMSGMEQPR